MLQVTKKVEYGLIALSYIAGRSGEPVSAREIAEKNGIPPSLTANVLKLLSKGRVVHTRRGAAGGYTLQREASSIMLVEVVEAVEGGVHLSPCCRENGRAGCDLVGSCVIKQSMMRLNRRLMGVIGGVSLHEFIELGARSAEPAVV